MKARVTEIKYGEGGMVLTVIVGEPWPPYRPPDGFHTEEDAADYDKALQEYNKVQKTYDHLRLGYIKFEYEEIGAVIPERI